MAIFSTVHTSSAGMLWVLAQPTILRAL